MKTSLPRLLALAAATILAVSSAQAQCTAGFTWTQPSNNNIDFTSTSTPFTQNSTFFTWDFGDSQTTWSLSQTVTHTYSAPGTYYVCVTMIDSLSSCTDQFCDSVTVTGTVLCNVNTYTTLIAPASCQSCADGSASGTMYGGTAPYTYAWSNAATTQTATGLLPGTYTVCITDANGCNACNTVTVSVANSTSCQASFTWSQTSQNIGDFVSTSTGLSGPNDLYMWNWGDNNSSFNNTSNTISHFYMNPGTYNVCLTILDSITQCTSTFCDSVTITGVPSSTTCNASFAVWLDSINPNVAWIWNNSTGSANMQYQWWWGDNTSDTIPYPTHTYSQTGTYNICLVVVDNANNCTDTMCQFLFVPRLTQEATMTPFYVNVIGGAMSVPEYSAAQWTLFPNPAENEIRIKTSQSLQGKQYRILDVTGRVIESGSLMGTQVNIASLDRGMYVLQIENDKGGFANQRFLKN